MFIYACSSPTDQRRCLAFGVKQSNHPAAPFVAILRRKDVCDCLTDCHYVRTYVRVVPFALADRPATMPTPLNVHLRVVECMCCTARSVETHAQTVVDAVLVQPHFQLHLFPIFSCHSAFGTHHAPSRSRDRIDRAPGAGIPVSKSCPAWP